jgi:hypothetical protein
MTTQQLRQKCYSPDPALARALKSKYILPQYPEHALFRCVTEIVDEKSWSDEFSDYGRFEVKTDYILKRAACMRVKYETQECYIRELVRVA